MRDHADVLARSLKDRTLFDVKLQHGMHLARAHRLFPDPADPRQLCPKGLALGIEAAIGIVLRVNARKDAAGQHGRGKARAFLVRPVGHNDGVPGADAVVVHRPHHFQRAQNAQHTVIFAARRLGIQMRAHVNGQGSGVFTRPGRKHRAHAVHTHRQARSLAPGLEQGAACGIGIGQGLAVIAARHARTDLGHLHQAVPQPRAVDPQVSA